MRRTSPSSDRADESAADDAAGAALHRQADELLRLAEGLGAAVRMVDARTGEIVMQNGLAGERFGDTPLRCGAQEAGAAPDTYCPCFERPLSECERRTRTPTCTLETDAADRHYWSVARPLRWVNDRRMCLQVTVDVTERRRLEEENALLAAALKQSGEATLVTDAEGQILYVSAAFERLTGWSADEVIGHTPRVLKSGEHDDRLYDELWSTIRSGLPWRGRMTNRRKDDSTYDADISITPVRDAGGTIRNFVAVQRDVTSDVEYQRLLRQAHKMQAVATLADGLSHELNNLLQPILGYATTIRDSLPTDDERRAQFDAIVRQAIRGADLTRRLSDFGRGLPTSAELVDVSAVVAATVRQLAATAPPAVRYRIDSIVPVGRVRASRARLRELVVNLCTNAVDALPAGGLIRVSLSSASLDRPLRTVNRELPAGEYARLRVEDDGVGIASDELERLFDPFFTRKGRHANERHSGLGLATVYGILQQYEGGVRVWSRPGEGTRVDAYLPLQAVPTVATAPHVDESPPRRDGTPTILVVDDEPDNVELARVILSRRGYRVLTAADGVEALDIWEREGGAIDVALLDVVMPRMDGAETFRRLRERDPSLPIAFVTGHDAEGGARHVRDAHAEFLFKPYTPAQLVERVRRLLH